MPGADRRHGAARGTWAWLHAGAAGYPLGGSLPDGPQPRAPLPGARRRDPLRRARGADPHPAHRRAPTAPPGVELADGTQEPAEIVISAADGHATIYEMLGGAYLDDELRDVYERDALPLFPPILFVGVGVARDFADEPQRISGLHLPSTSLSAPARPGRGAGGAHLQLRPGHGARGQDRDHRP